MEPGLELDPERVPVPEPEPELEPELEPVSEPVPEPVPVPVPGPLPRCWCSVRGGAADRVGLEASPSVSVTVDVRPVPGASGGLLQQLAGYLQAHRRGLSGCP